MSWRAGALSWYPIHITALNVLEKSCRDEIIENRTLVACFSVFSSSTNLDDARLSLNLFPETLCTSWSSQISHGTEECALNNCFPLYFPDLRPFNQIITNILYTEWYHLTFQILRRVNTGSLKKNMTDIPSYRCQATKENVALAK